MSGAILDRMELAVTKVRERLLRAAKALAQQGVPFAVVGGHAVASWVATVDEGAVRNTRDVDLLVRRRDLPAVTAALESAGFVRDEVFGVIVFRDGSEGKPSDGIHLLFAGEKVRADHSLPAPEIDTAQISADEYPVIALQPLVVMKLVSNRDKDRTHVRDLIGVGLVNESWLQKTPPEVTERLASILSTPDS